MSRTNALMQLLFLKHSPSLNSVFFFFSPSRVSFCLICFSIMKRPDLSGSQVSDGLGSVLPSRLYYVQTQHTEAALHFA